MNTEAKQREVLQKHGLKATATRIRVLEVLMNSDIALSHNDITERLDDASPDKVTLYRTLNAFVSCGLAHKVATEDRNWLYALQMHDGGTSMQPDDHAHFICDECERIYCLPMDAEYLKPAVPSDRGFIIKSQEFRLHGTCPECN
ncbi:Fur family transcriptional regulator [Natronogracilivirga saccharolytica]|uniref:Transcriptional repressor n=1 Tax=Natronogracilivirga saccharolytica TaxID=2812953 RepID=A0A8J7UXC1_9BACT|nr:Fur family transcriptional regulator [Natronogracilivirga saccharolytica]MBP3193149.1 transcriptional repressor [Natronogracilivirga saccharolytica]